jgi:hypothetical protein
VDSIDAEVVVRQRRDGTGLVPRTDHVGRTAKLARQDAQLGPWPDQIRATRSFVNPRPATS